MDNLKSRRSFLKQLMVGATVLPILNTLQSPRAYAQDVPARAVDSTDSMAPILGYVPDNTTVDKAKFPKYAAGQHCKLCALYLEGGKTVPGKSGEYGRCGLFQTGLVSADGWCNSFVAKVA